MNHFTACMNCKDREPGCHDTCERYLSEKAEYERIKSKHDMDKKTKEYYITKSLELKSDKAKRRKDKSHISMFYN